MDLEKILQRVGNVKLRGGIFGKMTWAVIVICICVTVLAYSTENLYISSATIVLMMAFALYFFSRLLNFAERHPQIAILDGSEFLVHEQILHAAKGQGVIPLQPSAIDHAQPDIELSALEADEVTTPKKIGGH